MKKHFLIYGILLFLIFEKVYDILSALVDLINTKQDLSNALIYLMLGISAVIPLTLFFFYLRKLKFDFKNLIILVIFYLLSFILLYYLNRQLGIILADNFELNQESNFLEIQVQGWSKTIKMLASIIVLTYLVVITLKELKNNS